MKFRWSFHAVFLLVFIFLLGVSFSNDTAINFLGNWSQSNPRIAESQHAEGLRSQDETVRLPSATDVAQHSATQNDELRSDLNSNTVQIVPLPSLATQILLNVNWQKTRDQGLRRVQLKPGAFLGPVAMRSFRGRLLFLDEADDRVVHLDSEGAIVESMALPVSRPNQFYLDDDGSMVVWGPRKSSVLYRSLSALGEIQNKIRRQSWQQIGLPSVHDEQTQSQIPVHPSRIFQFDGQLYVEHLNGRLYKVNQSDSNGLPTLPGRPTSQTGLFVSATLGGKKSESVLVQALDTDSRIIWKRELQFSGTDPQVIALESTTHHDFLVVAWEMTKQKARVTVCAKIDLSGRLISVLELGQTHFKGFAVQEPIVVDDKNSFLQMTVSLTGMTVERYAWK